MTPEDLTIIERAGRRCSGCHTGRHWRRFEVLRPEGREPLVACPACRPRLSAPPPAAAVAKPAPVASETAETPPTDKPPAASKPSASSRRRRSPRQPSQNREDRLKRALRDLPPGTYSTGRIAKAAGLHESKVIPRLRALEAAGEVQRVGRQWSNERPSTDLEAAFDRLQARTGNLRIIRPDKRTR